MAAVSQKAYERALEMAKRPDLDEETAGHLVDIIKEFRSSKPADVSPTATVEAARRKENAGEGPLLSVPGAESDLAQPPMNAAPGAFDVPTAAQAVEREDSPNVRRAKKFQAAPISKEGRPQPPEEGGPLTPEKITQMEAFYGSKGDEEYYDRQNTTTASQRRELIEPPEFKPEQAQEPEANISIMHPLDAARAIAQKIQSAKRGLPTSLGGDVQHFQEPGLDVFKKTMRPLLGAEVDTMTEGSMAYKEFADAVWKTVYNKSKAEGVPVVRQKYASGVANAAAGVLGAAGSFAGGYDEGLTGGVLQQGNGRTDSAAGLDEPGADKITNMEAVESSSPMSHDIGMALGFINPRSIGNLAASGVSKLAGGIAGKLGIGAAKGAIGKIATGAARGATQAAAGSAATDVMGNALGREDLSAQEIFGRAGTSALVGGPLGAVGGTGKAVSDAVRKAAPIGEALGSETSMLRGVKPGKEAIAIRERAAAAGVGPKEMIASEMEAPIAAHAREAHEGMVASHGEKNAQALARFGDERTPYGELLGAVSDAHEKLHGESGTLPFVKDDAGLRQAIKRMSTVELVPKGDGNLSIDEATKKGFDVQEAFTKLKKEGVPVEADELANHFDVMVSDKVVSPEELDTIISVVDNANKKSPLHNYEKFQAAARGVRDTFSPEWGATKSAIGKASHEMEKDLDAIGVGKNIGEHGLNFKQSQALQSLLAGGGSPGRTLATEGPLRRVAEGAGVGGQYKKILAMRELEQAEKAAKPSIPFIHFGSGGRGGVGETVRGLPLAYRMDPLLRKYGPTLGAAGAAAPSIDQISRMLAGQENQP